MLRRSTTLPMLDNYGGRQTVRKFSSHYRFHVGFVDFLRFYGQLWRFFPSLNHVLLVFAAFRHTNLCGFCANKMLNCGHTSNDQFKNLLEAVPLG